MREIEIKARVGNKAPLLAALKANGVQLSEPITQRDRVFGLQGVDGGDDTNGAPWLRIRSETKNGVTKQIFTLKKSVTNQMDSIEHETEVTSEQELEQIIKHIGFLPYSDLTKTRQKAAFGELEICVDSIEDFGNFIEVEKLTDENVDYEQVAEELWRVLESFGVSRDDHVTDGYDVMMRRKMGLKG